MKMINIYPIKNKKLYNNQSMNMFLTHLVLEYPEYAKLAKNYKGYKILDNSLIELGDSMGFDLILKAAKLIKADEIVLPDAFMNKNLTLKRTKKTLRDYKQELKKYKTMAVIHGETYEEIYDLYNIFRQNENIDVLGFPKVWTKQYGSRSKIVKALAENATNKEKHLLGIWNNLTELKEYTNLNIRSVDSSLAALLDIKEINNINYTRRDDEIICLEKDYIKHYNLIEEVKKLC